MQGGKVVFITHSEQADPGAVAQALKTRGYETEICCPCLGDTLPPLKGGKPEGYLASIILGDAPLIHCMRDVHGMRDMHGMACNGLDHFGRGSAFPLPQHLPRHV